MVTARDLADAIFDGREVRSANRIRMGNSKQTVVVRFAERDPVVVQFSETADLGTEGRLLRAVGDRTEVPVPTVVEFGDSEGVSFIATELASGENLHSRFSDLDGEVQRGLAREFGRYLGQIHDAFGFEAFGAVAHRSDGDSVVFRATGPEECREWLVPYARAGIDDLPSAFDGIRADLEHAVEVAPADLAGEPVLYPWDFRPGNALAADGELSAVLDWGDPLAGPAGLSATKAEYLIGDWYLADDEPVVAAFREGYGSVRPYPDVPPLYRLVAVLRSAVDSKGVVTRPRYPEWTGQDAVEFHLTRLRDLLAACE